MNNVCETNEMIVKSEIFEENRPILKKTITNEQKAIMEMFDIYNLSSEYNCKCIITSIEYTKHYNIEFYGTRENMRILSPILVKLYKEYQIFLNDITKIL